MLALTTVTSHQRSCTRFSQSITDDEAQLTQLRQFINTLDNVKRVEVLPYHTLGTFKWEKLDIPYSFSDVPTPTSEQIQRAEAILVQK